MNTKKIYRKVGDIVNVKGTNENSNKVYPCKILWFDGFALHVENEYGDRFSVNEWQLK